MTDDLQRLVERIEGASEASGELDALIRCAVFAKPGSFVRQSPINGAWCVYEIGYGGNGRLWEPHGLTQQQRLGSFTTSIDAAMTLVPEGWEWLRKSPETMTVYRPLDPMESKAWAKHIDGTGATPALALASASLRARITQEQSNDPSSNG